MKTAHVLSILVASMLGAGTALAAPAQGSLTVALADNPAPSSMTLGEVRKVDKEAGKITLKHEAIKNLDMPPMTMVFHAKDVAMLDKLKPGDKVRFAAISDNGALTVTRIEPVN